MWFANVVMKSTVLLLNTDNANSRQLWRVILSWYAFSVRKLLGYASTTMTGIEQWSICQLVVWNQEQNQPLGHCEH
jgi:hypothetical protein